ncbi:hypothetical protein [Mycobacterium sp. Lab-001]|uniref:hypothetical protein n=1 Tax=Mycobacterium sp. Lab-001 TaxID=3410136 RepID=UPI003D164145
MGIARPTGEYVEQMLASGGWPEVDEEAFYDCAGEYTRVLRKVTEVLDACRHQQSEVFDGGIWSGGAASAANGELTTNIGELVDLQNGLATVITWHKYVARSIAQAKSDIGDNVENAYRQINALENDSRLDADERATAIDTVVTATNEANVGVIGGTAERIRASKSWTPPGHALQELLDQKLPPPVEIPDAPTPSLPEEHEQPRPGPAQPGPVGPAPVPPARPPQPTPAMPAPTPATPAPGATPQPTPATPPLPGQPAVSPAPVPGPPGPAAPGSPGTGPGAPLQPAASTPSLGGGKGAKGLTPAAASPTAAQPPSSGLAEDSSASVAPAAATGMPAAPMAPGGAGAAAGGGGAGSGTRAASVAPLGQKASGTTASTRPAATGKGSARIAPAGVSGPAAQRKPNEHKDTADATVMAPIPVSAARAERDAIAEAATAEATRRKNGGADPLRLARRIAAALNAPGGGGQGDFGFFWVTAVTTDGAIVVANSYGLAYIPEGVQLPEPVLLASADETILPAERARWATYPVTAVQGWANHRDAKLRAVIATEEQFANSDPGAAKIVLTLEDIPAAGQMVGRSRLDVVAPAAAERLAETADVRLTDLLPPAPADARLAAERPTSPEAAMDDDQAALLAASVAAGTVSLDELLAKLPSAAASNASADQRPMLWFEVMKPMSSSATGRQAAHLRAFHTYATHAQEVLLLQAHTAVDPVAQRAAVTDWLYWKHVGGVLDAALTDAS